MTPTETADYLQIPVQTLEKWRSQGTGPEFMRIGKHVRYRRSVVDLWLTSCTRQQTG